MAVLDPWADFGGGACYWETVAGGPLRLGGRTCLFIAGVGTLDGHRVLGGGDGPGGKAFPGPSGGFIGVAPRREQCGGSAFSDHPIGGASEPGFRRARWACSWRSRRITT